MPDPAKSVEILILEHIQTALRAINGNPTYFYTVKSGSVVLDATLRIFDIPKSELPFFMVDGTLPPTMSWMPAKRVKVVLSIVILARQDATGNATNMKTEVWRKLGADIEVALTQDITRGGNAIDTRLEPRLPLIDPGPSQVVLVQQPLNVRFIRTYGTP